MPSIQWFPLHIEDYRRDTQALSTLEHGAYLLLMHEYYSRQKALPDNDRKLAGITKMTLPDWLDIRPSIEEFFQVADGLWRHKRIDLEVEKAQSLSDKRRKAREGANKQPTIVGTIDSTNDPTIDAHTGASHLTLNTSVSNETGVPPNLDDPKDWVWKDGLAWLAEQTGRTQQAIRPQVGRWCKQFTEDAVQAVLVATIARKDGPPADPISWIEACLKRKSAGSPEQSTGGERERDWPARLAKYEMGGFWPERWGPRPEDLSRNDSQIPMPVLAAWRAANLSGDTMRAAE